MLANRRAIRVLAVVAHLDFIHTQLLHGRLHLRYIRPIHTLTLQQGLQPAHQERFSEYTSAMVVLLTMAKRDRLQLDVACLLPQLYFNLNIVLHPPFHTSDIDEYTYLTTFKHFHTH